MRNIRELIKRIRQSKLSTLSIFMCIAILAASLPLGAFAISLNNFEITEGSMESSNYESYTYELTEKRDEYVKYFKNPDGTVTAVQFDMPVHRLNNDGEWDEIDNTLISSVNEYTTQDARIKFAKKTTGNEVLFTLHDGNSKITLSLDGAEKKIVGDITNFEVDEDADDITKLSHLNKLNSSIVYRNILDSVDIEYITVSNSIKENIIVKTPLSDYIFTFTMKLNNLTAEETEDGGIAVKNEGTSVYKIAPPYMYDANEEISENVSYTLTSFGNNEYKITVIADKEWINSEDRIFPITIDPSISPADGTVTDLHLVTTYPNANNSTSSQLYVGDGYIGYWKNTELPEIPNYAYITTAELSLYKYAGNSNYIGIH